MPLRQIDLPTDLAELDNEDHWRELWQQIANGNIKACMDETQVDAVKATLDFYAWACTHHDEVLPVWGEFCEMLEFAASMVTLHGTPGENMLLNVKYWAADHFPVSESPIIHGGPCVAHNWGSVSPQDNFPLISHEEGDEEVVLQPGSEAEGAQEVRVREQ